MSLNEVYNSGGDSICKNTCTIDRESYAAFRAEIPFIIA